MTDDFGSIRKTLENFDVVDLASGVGGLQLDVRNLERQLRFERIAALVVGLPHQDGRTLCSPSRWRSILNQSPIARTDVKRAEDPAEDLFTDSIAFHGGNYVVFPGIAEDSVAGVRALLRAAFLSTDPMPSQFTDEMKPFAYALLRLSDQIARRAMLNRGLPPDRSGQSDVIIPPSAQFLALKEAVRFSAVELAAAISPVSINSLAPVIGRFGAVTLDPDDHTQLGYCYLHPILVTGDTYIVLVPSGLLVALRHLLIVRASEMGLEDKLASRLADVANNLAARSLRYMNVAPSNWTLPAPPPWARESIWSFDVDKIAHVLVITDDLTNYPSNDPFSHWSSDLSTMIEDRLLEARIVIRREIAGISEIFHIIVHQSVGRSFILGLSSSAVDVESAVLSLDQSALGVMARCEIGDQLALWKFARAGNALRDTTRVMAWSTLDEYGLYRSSRHSFYLNDDARPNLITIATDFGTDLRLEDAARFDAHAALMPDRGGHIEVQRLWPGSPIPIYSPYAHPIERLALLVESTSLQMWIIQGVEYIDGPDARELYLMLCDAIAYWLWQVAEKISALIIGRLQRVSALTVYVVLKDTDAWSKRRQEESVIDWLTLRARGPEAIELTMRPQAQTALNGPDNSGERELLKRTLTFILETYSEISGADLLRTVNEIIDLHAPLGPKKKLLFLDASHDMKLLPGALPPARLIKDADVQTLLDVAGPAVFTSRRLAQGRIEPSQRVDILNEIVSLHFTQFQKLVASLRPNGLRERLLNMHESVVHHSAHQQFTLPTQIACFGSDAGHVAEITDRIHDLTHADVVSRFLIEYVAAQPPCGEKALSLSDLDMLMALASEVINKGMLSDALHFDLATIEMSVLASGRLGIDQESRYLTGMGMAREASARQEVQRASRHFAQYWETGEDNEERQTYEELNLAALDEFGVTVTDVAHFMATLIDLRLNSDSDPMIMPLDKLRDHLIGALSWSGAKVNVALELFSLRPRKHFFPQDDRTDVYPWRFNRQLSYLRRPLLQWEENGVVQTAWGPRHLERVGPYLVRTIMSGRLKARSPRMVKYVSRMRNADAEAFNDIVAGVFQSRTGLIVRKRVKKIGSIKIENSPGSSLGDIDVLVASPSSRRLLAIEVKDFEPARTPAELSNEMSQLFADEDSALSHHTQRLDWLRGHVVEVCDWLGVPRSRRRWRVDGLIVVSRDLISRFMRESPIEVISFDALRNTNGTVWI